MNVLIKVDFVKWIMDVHKTALSYTGYPIRFTCYNTCDTSFPMLTYFHPI